ncbi:hypothetical protein BGW80DRAFT_1419860 [Lactifluus volemus]|nr:hypothetical protein BGW80DRAFT_1419860 [Lactifluus volemus]
MVSAILLGLFPIYVSFSKSANIPRPTAYMLLRLCRLYRITASKNAFPWTSTRFSSARTQSCYRSFGKLTNLGLYGLGTAGQY